MSNALSAIMWRSERLNSISQIAGRATTRLQVPPATQVIRTPPKCKLKECDRRHKETFEQVISWRPGFEDAQFLLLAPMNHAYGHLLPARIQSNPSVQG